MAHPTPPEIDRLLNRNREWQRSVVSRNKDFFSTSNQSQKPTYLWIGCADSRVPVNEIFGGIPPGEIFVHRNIANIVHPTDLSLLSVLTYAVEHLKVPHIIVAGHYNCGGVKAGMGTGSVDMLDNWLRPVKDLQSVHARDLEAIESNDDRFRILCELNTLASANNIAYTNVVQKAWASGQNLTIRAWVYDLATGLIRDLDFVLDRPDDIDEKYRLDIKKESAPAPALKETQAQRFNRAVRQSILGAPAGGINGVNGKSRAPALPTIDSGRRGDSRSRSRSPNGMNGQFDRRGNNNSAPLSATNSTNTSLSASASLLRLRLRHSSLTTQISLATPFPADANAAQRIVNKIKAAMEMHGIDPRTARVAYRDVVGGGNGDDEGEVDWIEITDGRMMVYVLEIAAEAGVGPGGSPLNLIIYDLD